jgi:hypothetical protein
MCIDESNRKNKFHQVAEIQEPKIKDYVSSLNSLIASDKNRAEDSMYSSRLPISTSLSSLATTSTISSILNNLLSTTNSKKHMVRSPELSYEALPLVASNLLLTSTKTSITPTPITPRLPIKKIISNTTPQLHLDDNVDCCDVKISYWYQEDSIQNLLIQSLMLILITSRWLITRAELNLNQRSLILVISIATGADTIDFFSYLNLELVYQNDYLLYSTLLILSLSLLQFVFLHVEDSLNLTSTSSNVTGSNSNFSISNSTNNSTNEDNVDILKRKNNKIKKPKNLPFLYKQYLLFKNHLKPSSTATSSNNSPLKNQLKTKDSSNEAKNSNAIEKNDRKLIKINLPSYNRVKKQNSRHAIINGFPLHKNSATKYFCYLFCCCIEQKDPLFFILLAGLFLHDGSYLTFRIFILSKLGLEATLNQSPSLIFFMVKNLFIIITQIYKVYTVTSERRQRRFYENYRDFVFATQQDNYAAAMAAAKQNTNSNNNNNNNNSNSTNNLNNLNNYQQNFNVALAAATGGQVPLVPINSFPAYHYPNQHLFLNQHLYQPPTSNPYRFAQLYTDIGPIGHNAMRRSLSPGNRLNNRSASTLGSVNTNLFCDNLNNNNNKNKNNKKNKNNNAKNQKSKSANNPNTENNYYYRSNHLYKPTQQNAVSFQLEQTPISDTELFYGVINAHNINGDKIYDQNMTICHTPTTGHANMSTPINPYLAKTSKPFYGVSFINRSRSSSALDLRDNFRSSTKNDNLNQTGFNAIYGVEYNEFNPYQRGNYHRSSMHNNTSTAARLIKASKI